MKISTGHRMTISSNDILKYPEAISVADTLVDGEILLKSAVPINENPAYKNPAALLETLKKGSVEKIIVDISQELAPDLLLEQLIKLDPTITVVCEETKLEALSLMEEIFSALSLDAKMPPVRERLLSISERLCVAVEEASQIGLSLVRTDIGNYHAAHSLNVALLCGYIANRMSRSSLVSHEMVQKSILAGLLFDIGQAIIPAEIANKTEKLSDEEFQIIKQHVLSGTNLCKEAGIDDQDVLAGILRHHERYDGSGYLDGLVGESIPFIARLIAVADTFDAMTSLRSHRGAVSGKASASVIINANETLFDPDICKAFLAATGIYPPGTMVELSSGAFGMVVAVTEGNLLQPKVAIQEESGPRVLNLTQERLFIRRSLDAQAAINPFDR